MRRHPCARELASGSPHRSAPLARQLLPSRGYGLALEPPVASPRSLACMRRHPCARKLASGSPHRSAPLARQLLPFRGRSPHAGAARSFAAEPRLHEATSLRSRARFGIASSLGSSGAPAPALSGVRPRAGAARGFAAEPRLHEATSLRSQARFGIASSLGSAGAPAPVLARQGAQASAPVPSGRSSLRRGSSSRLCGQRRVEVPMPATERPRTSAAGPRG